MTPERQRVVDYVLWVMAFVWPFGVLLQLPILGVNLLTAIALILAGLLVPEVYRDRKLRVPFEVWMPSAIIAGVALYSIWIEYAPRHRNTIEALLLLILIIQTAPSQDAIRRYLFAAMISVFTVTVVSLFTPPLGLMPTAFSFRSGAAFTFAYNLGEAVHILLTGAALALYIVSDRRFNPPQRAFATGSLILIATLLLGQAIHWYLDTRALPAIQYPLLRTEQWIAASAALWLCARILAKVEVDRRAQPDRVHWFWWMAGLATVVVVAAGPLQPRAYQGVLLGFACATALPPRLTARTSRPVVGVVVACALAAANLFFVFPENVDDPRQYDAAAQREAPLIFDRMDWVDRHAPNERRTYLWRARAALEARLPNLASFAFERAARMPEGFPVLPAPSDGELQQFLVDMRDVVATMPEDRAVCAYERVLLAIGERDSALYSLRLQTSVALMHSPTEDVSSYTPVVAMILGDPSIADDLRAWDPDEVLTLLSHWGTDAAFAVGQDEAPGGLFILAAQRTWDTFNVLVRVGEKVTRFEEPLAPVVQSDIVPLTEVSAMVWAGPEAQETAGVERYTLNVVTNDGVKPAAYIDIGVEGAASFAWAKNPPVIEYAPAVRIRLAK